MGSLFRLPLCGWDADKFRPLRIVSLTLFSITLVKLLLTISAIYRRRKIAAFFCLGVLLLVVSSCTNV